MGEGGGRSHRQRAASGEGALRLGKRQSNAPSANHAMQVLTRAKEAAVSELRALLEAQVRGRGATVEGVNCEACVEPLQGSCGHSSGVNPLV